MSTENEESLEKTLRNLRKNKKKHMGEKRKLQKTKKNNKSTNTKKKEKRSMKILIQLKPLPTQKLICRFRGGRSMRRK